MPASSVLLFLQRVGFQEEISKMNVTALCAEILTEAPHLLPGYFLHSRIAVILANFFNSPKEERKKRKLIQSRLTANMPSSGTPSSGTAVQYCVWCYPYIFCFLSANVSIL